MTTTLQLSDKTLADIARNVAKYPAEQKQSAVMAITADCFCSAGYLATLRAISASVLSDS